MIRLSRTASSEISCFGVLVHLARIVPVGGVELVRLCGAPDLGAGERLVIALGPGELDLEHDLAGLLARVLGRRLVRGDDPRRRIRVRERP
jgi:hypothetical protein